MKKIAITLEEDSLAMIDSMVADGLFPNRSKVVQAAVRDKLTDLQKMRLFNEVMKLSPEEEQSLANNIGGQHVEAR